MSRFFFDVRIAGDLFADPEGSEMQNIGSAREHAARIARGVMSGEALEGRMDLGSSVEVRDQLRRLVLTLFFRDAIQILSATPATPNQYATAPGRPGAHLRLVLGSPPA